MSDAEGEVLPDGPTQPYHAPVTLRRFQGCYFCMGSDRFDDSNALQLDLEDEPLGPETVYGHLTAMFVECGYLQQKVCVHGATMTLSTDPDFLSIVAEFIQGRMMDIDRPWARKIVERANACRSVS